MSPKIASVAVIGKLKNNNLYIKVFSQKETDLTYHFMIHSACDELEAARKRYISGCCSQDQEQSSADANLVSKSNERSLQMMTGNKSGCFDMYLGLLHSQETASVYGSMTNTRIKFIVVLDNSDMTITDSDIKPLLKAIHSAYIGYVCNPFYIFDDKTPIQSRKFDKMIEQIVESWTPCG
ncbi:hypothetical protein PORY_001255 [Pneumocystis oryctolagi]|uniref:Uncharacterized protein n=1 Tax=Pneumocystis oryctolagi TaxID=42067 RepID=A0ACB7CCF8_9ASCO|nr:hypothetical protein PORY_001255 [Pneumocystis oryctolagi]